jgi:hypothetical protein
VPFGLKRMCFTVSESIAEKIPKRKSNREQHECFIGRSQNSQSVVLTNLATPAGVPGSGTEVYKLDAILAFG